MNQLKPITEHVCDMLRERSQRGLAKYGTTIDRDDLSPAQWLQHLQEELLDAAQYVEALKRQAAPPAAVPDGYALVPVEPTPEMIAAGWFGGEMHVALGHANAYRECEGDYARLLAAANKENNNG